MNHSRQSQTDGCRCIADFKEETLNVLVLYDSRSSAIRAKAMLKGLEDRFSFEFEFAYDFWRFDVLELVEVQELARHAAETADIIVVAASRNARLSPAVRQYVDGCILQKRRCSQAKIGLFEPLDERMGESEMRQFLEGVRQTPSSTYYIQAASEVHENEQGQGIASLRFLRGQSDPISWNQARTGGGFR